MIPNEVLQKIDTTAGVEVVGNFKITDETQARILVSLSSKMYSKKELAVIREYSNNANDAHIVVGKPTSEVIVTLPTLNDVNFRIRDFGTGLTRGQIRDVYCVLGASTKRNSVEQNGVLGYGCKAGFAHADSFTVTAWINGEQTIYNCIKGDSTRLHSVIELSRTPSDAPSGIEVCVPVQQNSLWTFHREAADFFKYWTNLPTINNMEGDSLERMTSFRKTDPTLKGEGWNVRPKSDGTAKGVAFMGGVAYLMDWTAISNRMALDSQKRVLLDLLQHNDVTLFYKMGEVQFVDSREGLEYTEHTLSALTARIETIFAKIKESIQEKFDVATNIWEAKLIYNAIFGTGVLEVEKGEDADCIDRIKILDGNLMQLENTFNGAFTWNGRPLTSSGFNGIHRFDNAYPSEVQSGTQTPIEPVMVTYRRKKLRAKINRCTSEKNHKIVASHPVAIVINDIGTKMIQSVVARYLMFGKESNINTVHVLNFCDSTAKETFYKELDFATVPVIKISEILVDAKTWQNSNKVSRSYGTGGGGARPMRYMNIAEGRVEDNEVPIRSIEDGGIYIEEIAGGRGRYRTKKVQMKGYSCEEPSEIVEHLQTLVEKTGLDLDRVYIINAKTADSKWFQEAKQSGDWINVWKYIQENLEVDIASLVEADAYSDTSTVNKEAADMIVPLIMDKNSPVLTLIATVSDKDYDATLELVRALRNLYLWNDIKGDVKSRIDYAKASEDVKASYPYLDMSHLNNSYYINAENMAKIAKYINAMDLYVDLTFDNTPKVEAQPELVAA